MGSQSVYADEAANCPDSDEGHICFGLPWKARMPGKRFLSNLLSPSTREAVDLSKTKYDVDKLRQLMSLYDALCASNRQPSFESFIRRSDVLQLYDMDSLPEKKVKAPSRSTVHQAMQRGDIPRHLMAPDGYQRTITELTKDPAVGEAVRLKLRERRELKKQAKHEIRVPTSTPRVYANIIKDNASTASTYACNMSPQLDQRGKSIAWFSNISWQNFDRFGEF
jgi:hypothetical protein